MDYIYSELNKNLVTNPYGSCYYYMSDEDDVTELTEAFKCLPLSRTFDTDGYTITFEIESSASQYEYFAFPKQYGLLISILREYSGQEAQEDITNWSIVESSSGEIVDTDGTIYYMYKTDSAIEDHSLVTFIVEEYSFEDDEEEV